MCPEFIQEVRKYDILCFSETKTDGADAHNVGIQGYVCFLNNRHELPSHRSGGIAIHLRQELASFFKTCRTNM